MSLYGSKSKFERGHPPAWDTGYDGIKQSVAFQDKAVTTVKAAQALDLDKIWRQIGAVVAKTEASKRVAMIKALLSMYVAIEMIALQNVARIDRNAYQRQVDNGDKAIKTFKALAAELGWDGSGAKLPRPFNRLFLERLFWQANLILLGPEEGRRPAISAKKRDFDAFRY